MSSLFRRTRHRSRQFHQHRHGNGGDRRVAQHPGGPSRDENIEDERYIDLLDSQDARAGQFIGRVAGALVSIGNKYVTAGKTLPAVMGRAALVESAKGFAHDAIATPGGLEEGFESGVQGGLVDAMYAPLGPLAEHGATEIAPLAIREHPLLGDIVEYLAANAPQELANAVAQAESRGGQRPRPVFRRHCGLPTYSCELLMQPIVLSAAISGVCAVAAALVAGAFSHAAGRRAGKAKFILAVQAAASEVIARLREEIDRLTARCALAEARCESAEQHHRACRAELDALWAEVRAKPASAYVNPNARRAGRPRKAKP